MFDDTTYTYICADTGEVIFDVLETTAIQGNIKLQYHKTRNVRLRDAQTFTIQFNLICDFGTSIKVMPKTRVYFDIYDDGLKAKMWRHMRCPYNIKRVIRIAWLSVDFSDSDRMLIRRLIIDNNHSRKYTWVVSPTTHVVTFNYERMPPAEIRRVAVAAAVVTAFAIYTGLNSRTKMLKHVNRQHRTIASAVAYILYRAGYIRPYKLVGKRLVSTDSAFIDGKPLNKTQITTPWTNMKDKKEAVRASLQYLAMIAKKLTEPKWMPEVVATQI